MDIHIFPSSALLLASFLFLLMLIKKSWQSNTQEKPASKLPPGPWKLPIIGSMHHLIGMHPHRAFRALAQRFGPVMHLRLGQIDLIVISSKEGAAEVMKAQDLNFASRPMIAATKILTYGNRDIAFAPYGQYWRQLRKICTLELLSVRRVRTFGPIREEETSILMDSIAAAATSRSQSNLSEMLTRLNNNIIARAAFGKECKDQAIFLSRVQEAILLASSFDIVDLFPSLGFLDYVTRTTNKLKRIHIQIDEIHSRILKEHKMKGKSSEDENEDLIDVLLKANDSGDLDIPLTESDMKAVMLDMFTAGTETTSSTTEWAMIELVRHPRVMEKAQTEVRRVLGGKTEIRENDFNELHYLKMVIKETLRLHPPVPLLVPRVCRESCQVGGYTIPKGSRVVVNVWQIGRDPLYWDDPESFKPERFDGSSIDFRGVDFEYLPFGAGRRICPGMAFGLASLEFTLAHLLGRFKWELPDGMRAEDVDMSEISGATVRKKQELYMVATPNELFAVS